MKLPFIQNVISMDRRILDLETPSVEAITSDQKRLVVDTFARYRIENPLRFFQATGGSALRGNQQLGTFMDAALRRVLGESTFQLVVKDDRQGLTQKIREQVNGEAQALGCRSLTSASVVPTCRSRTASGFPAHADRTSARSC